MSEPELTPAEEAFMDELDQHINEWVAITRWNTEKQSIVGHGPMILHARTMAERKGFTDVAFLRVPPPGRYIPTLL